MWIQICVGKFVVKQMGGSWLGAQPMKSVMLRVLIIIEVFMIIPVVSDVCENNYKTVLIQCTV